MFKRILRSKEIGIQFHMKRSILYHLLIIFVTVCFATCEKPTDPVSESPVTREERIPDGAVKITPKADLFPPLLNVTGWNVPVPMPGPVNTSGGEDSPFITPDGQTFFFFFTPDVQIPAEKQLLDGVTGIWWCQKSGDDWTEPKRIVLYDDLSLDGAPFFQDPVLWFGSIRPENFGEIDVYTAQLESGKWTHIENAGAQLNQKYDIGEFHLTQDGMALYCGGAEKWGDFSGKDIYVLSKTDTGWTAPSALPAPINTSEYNEDQPFISSDGNELWFTGQSRQGKPGPAVFRSTRQANGSWDDPVEVISQFAGEPTLDDAGNLYFVHHFFDSDMNMIEADIYVAYRQ